MLKIFRRHRPECEFGPDPVEHPELTLYAKIARAQKKLTPKEIRAKARSYPYCNCACWFSGTTYDGRRFKRTALHTEDWKEAERLVALKSANPAEQAKALLLSEALDRWYEATALAKRASGTQVLYKRVGAALLTAAQQQQVTTLAATGTRIISDLRLAWVAGQKIEDATHRLYLAVLTRFFRFCMEEEWITKSPVPKKRDWPPKPVDEDREETLPLDPHGGDANYRKILAAILVPVLRRPNGSPPPILRGEKLAALCELMYETGLRISDAITFRPGKLVLDDQVATYTFVPIKAKRIRKTCTTFLPLWLAHKLRALSVLSPGYPFFDGASQDDEASRNRIYFSTRKELLRIGDTIGIADLRAHRFRDSFAVNCLTREPEPMPIEHVSKMLGHKSVATTEEYYSPWTKGRQDHLRRAYLRNQKPLPSPVSADAVTLSDAVALPKAANE
jgi:integrase